MWTSAPDGALRTRIDSLRLRLQDRLLAEVADQAEWSYGCRIDCSAATGPVDPSGLARLARDFVPGGAAGVVPMDAALARIVAAWELKSVHAPQRAD